MQFQNKSVGLLTITSALIALASLVFSAIFVNYHFEAFNDPSIILALPNVHAEAGKWSMICDMLGYYMLLLPIIFYMHEWLKDKTAWSNTITFCGLAYVIIGCIGAAILAVTWPNAVHAYAQASTAEQRLIQANFNMANTIVYDGMWNLLEELFAGIWWLATGLLLFRNNVKGIAIMALITGASSLLDPLAAITGNNALHQFALNIYLYAAIVWAAWTGIVIYHRPLAGKKNKYDPADIVKEKNVNALLAAEV